MLRIQLLGGLSVVRVTVGSPSADVGAGTRRKPLALLAILASAGERGISRDKAAAYLWPEAATHESRAVLRQTLYSLRREVSEPFLAHGTGDLRLNAAVVESDVAAFDLALERGLPNEAVALYRGPFLDGFHLSHVPEFERWVEDERARLEMRAHSALETLANYAERRGEHDVAAGWWRQLLALDPFNSRVALGTMRALAASGDAAGALRRADQHTARVREELGGAPDAAVLELAESLRRASAAGGTRSSLRVGDLPSVESAPFVASRKPIETAPPTMTEDDPTSSANWTPEGDGRRRWRLSRRVAGRLLAAGAALLLVWLGFALNPSAPAVASEQPERIVVFPFTVTGESSIRFLRRGVMELLSRNLDGAGTFRSIDPRAVEGLIGSDTASTLSEGRGAAISRKLGARNFVTGQVIAAGGNIRVNAALYEVEGDRPVRVTVEGTTAELFSVVDRLTARLLVGSRHQTRGSLTRTAALMTDSLTALKLYLEGERLIRAGEFARAVRLMEQSVAIDSTFALGHYRLAFASEWAIEYDRARSAVARARYYSARLPEHDRLLVEAFDAYLNGRIVEAEGTYRRVLARFPEDVEAWYQLGEVLYHGSHSLIRPLEESRVAWQNVLRYEPDHASALIHLTRIAASERRREEFDTLSARLVRTAVRGDRRWELRVLRDAAFGDAATVDRLVADLRAADDETLALAVVTAIAYTDHLSLVRRLALILAEPHRSEEQRELGYFYLATAAAGAGRWRDATAAFGQLGALRPTEALLMHALLASGPSSAASPAELDSLRAKLRATPVSSPRRVSTPRWLPRVDHLPVHSRLYLIGHLSARLGDFGAALRAADSLEKTPSPLHSLTIPADFALGVRALVAAQRGDSAEALKLLESMRREGPLELLGTAFYGFTPENALQAALYEQGGNLERALLAYGSLPRTAIAQGHEARGRVFERLGQQVPAAREYAKFIALWAESDGEQRGSMARARARLAALTDGVP